IIEAFAADDDVRVIVMKGAGDKAFVAGADISQFAEKRGSKDAVAEYNTAVAAANQALLGVAKPLIAMVRGYCIGGGLGLAVTADIRIAAEDARFAVPAAKLGLGYAYDGLKALTDLV